jgi:hypothetical protein
MPLSVCLVTEPELTWYTQFIIAKNSRIIDLLMLQFHDNTEEKRRILSFFAENENIKQLLAFREELDNTK